MRLHDYSWTDEFENFDILWPKPKPRTDWKTVIPLAVIAAVIAYSTLA